MVDPIGGGMPYRREINPLDQQNYMADHSDLTQNFQENCKTFAHGTRLVTVNPYEDSQYVGAGEVRSSADGIHNLIQNNEGFFSTVCSFTEEGREEGDQTLTAILNQSKELSSLPETKIVGNQSSKVTVEELNNNLIKLEKLMGLPVQAYTIPDEVDSSFYPAFDGPPF